MTYLEKKSLKLTTENIKVVITDIDGVLTDGKIFYFKGKIYRAFNIKDGTGFKLLKMAGMKIVVISAKRSEETKERFSELGVDHYMEGVDDKLQATRQFIQSSGINWNEVCYIGDDLQDIPLIQKVGFSIAPYDACKEVRDIVCYVCKNKGGNGAFREAVEIILKEVGIWKDILKKLLVSS